MQPKCRQYIWTGTYTGMSPLSLFATVTCYCKTVVKVAEIYQTNIKRNPFQSQIQQVTVKYLDFADKYGGEKPTLKCVIRSKVGGSKNVSQIANPPNFGLQKGSWLSGPAPNVENCRHNLFCDLWICNLF